MNLTFSVISLVSRILVKRYGIPAVRVTAIGFGEDKPLVVDSAIQNKRKNRRVVAVIRTIKGLRG